MSATRFAFVTSKGGVCKTTLTCIMASSLHYGFKNKAYRVAVIDADPQQSFFTTRTNEAKMISSLPAKEYEKVVDAVKLAGQTDVYQVVPFPMNEVDVAGSMEQMDDDYDFILVDTPGSTPDDDMLEVLKAMDFLFIPFDTSEYVVTATKDFLEYVFRNVYKKEDSSVRAVCLVQVKYPLDKSSREISFFKTWAEVFQGIFPELDIMKEPLYESHLFKNMTSPDAVLFDGENAGKDNKGLLQKYVNTLMPFPGGEEFKKVSPYNLVKEILAYINKNSKN